MISGCVRGASGGAPLAGSACAIMTVRVPVLIEYRFVKGQDFLRSVLDHVCGCLFVCWLGAADRVIANCGEEIEAWKFSDFGSWVLRGTAVHSCPLGDTNIFVDAFFAGRIPQ
jgi:hypothetical protein